MMIPYDVHYNTGFVVYLSKNAFGINCSRLHPKEITLNNTILLNKIFSLIAYFKGFYY